MQCQVLDYLNNTNIHGSLTKYLTSNLLVPCVTRATQTPILHHIALSTTNHARLNFIGTSCHVITTTYHMTLIHLPSTASLIQSSMQFT